MSATACISLRHGAWLLGLQLLLSVPASGQVLPTDQTDGTLVFTQPHTRDTDLLGAIGDSMKLLMIEHGWRVAFQEETRRELGGPFFQDYIHSVKWPTQWDDTDPWAVNYIGHPLHGAAAGRIWLDHGKFHATPTSLSTAYWSSRARATAFSALYSLQFEWGPLSEASIGNVGMHPGTNGWVDHVVTPAGAFAVMVTEDALDHYFLEWFERRVSNSAARASLRVLFGPSRALSNIVESQLPWYRPNRPLDH